jgi:hypothetical protein
MVIYSGLFITRQKMVLRRARFATCTAPARLKTRPSRPQTELLAVTILLVIFQVVGIIADACQEMSELVPIKVCDSPSTFTESTP